MRTAPFGPERLDVAVVGQGTWNIERADETRAVAALEAGIALGLTHIDTAELYGGGRAERIVARAIAGRRDEVFLVSKVLPTNAAYANAIAACERTLKRLGTDHLDVYLLHWRGSVPLEETLRAFETLEKTGKIKAYGVSNFDVDDLEEAVAITGENRIVCNQVLYHLRERSIEYTLIPWCREHDIAVVAYSPFGSGDFPDLQRGAGGVLGEIAAGHGVSAYAVALAFLIRQGDVFTIPKAARAAHVVENATAGDLALSSSELRALDAAFPARRRKHLATI